VTRRAIVLAVVPLGFAVLIGVPLGLCLGSYQWLCAGIAVGLTIPPGVITLIWTERLSNSSPAARVAALAIGPVVRLLMGFGGAVLVFKLAQPTFQVDPLSFWGWVLGAYLTTLIVETAMLGRKVSERPA
jgi:hypothetical protein